MAHRKRTWTAVALLGLTSVGLAFGGMRATDPPKVGEKAPVFKLTDTEEEKFDLEETLKRDDVKAVVLEWFNPGCPYVVKHHQRFTTMKKLDREFREEGVVWIAINSGAEGKQGAGIETNREYKKKWAIDYPILLDESGKVGKAYGATNTPHMFVIGKEGNLVYKGAIDDNRSPSTLGETNYVKQALQEYLAGETVSTPETKAYGCGVKYNSRG